jgi:hypothetical protein
MAAGRHAAHPPSMALQAAIAAPTPLRLDHALARDLRTAAASRPVQAFLVLQVASAALFVARRGPGVTQTVLLVWAGLAFVAFICWWAGRHRLAHPDADPVPRARPRLVAGLTVAGGLAIGTYGIHMGASAILVLAGIGGWLLLAVRPDSGPGLPAMLRRSWRPFGPLLILVVLPRLALMGLLGPAALIAGLASGVVQELLFLPMVFASLEAVLGRRDRAVVVAALIFGSIHVPMNLAASNGDWLAALANAVFYQSLVGAIVCMAYTRHRAELPIGVAHGLTIA